MKIGIIGAGQIGGTLTRRLTKLGHEVFVANSRGPASLAGLARETGAKPVSVREAARAGEVVVVTIPEAKIRDLPGDLFAGVPDDVVVIDTGNYYPRERDGRIGDIEAGMTESRWVEHQLGGRSSRRLITSMPNTCWSAATRLAAEGGSPCLWPATTTTQSRPSFGL